MTFESGQYKSTSPPSYANPTPTDLQAYENGTLPDDWTVESLRELVNDDARVEYMLDLLNARSSTCRTSFVAVHEADMVDRKKAAERRKEEAEKRSGELHK